MPDIHPVHSSIRRRVVRRTPQGMDRVQIEPATRVELTKIALGIFADCTNIGVPFQDALLAIYLSGLQHGSALGEDTPE